MSKYLVLTLIVGVGTWFCLPGEVSPAPETEARQANPEEKAPGRGLVIQARQSISIPITGEVSVACSSLWSEMLSKDLGDDASVTGAQAVVTRFPFVEYLRSSTLSTRSGCILNPEHHLFSAQQRLIAACANASIFDCMRSFVLFRADLVEELTRETKLQDIDDKKIVSAKLLSRVAAENPDLAKIREASRRLLQLDPQNEDGAVYLLKASYIEFRSAGNTSSRELEVGIERFEQLHPDSQEILEMRMNLARSKGEIGLLRKLASEAKEKKGSAGISEYYLAWAAQIENDNEGAIAHLSMISPDDPRYFSASAALESLKAGEAPLFLDPSGSITYTVVGTPEP